MQRAFSDLPKHVAIEIGSHCNRDCFFCPRHGDRSGKRKDAAGTPVIKRMPTERVYDLMRQVKEMGYEGNLNFHHLSEPFLDKRLIEFARHAKAMGFRTLIHTNGDVLRRNYKLCRESVAVFDEISVGLYDYRNSIERALTELFWKYRLRGTDLYFSRHEMVFPRHDIDTNHPQMANVQQAIKAARPTTCNMVREHLIVHYDGSIGLCCEDYVDIFHVGNAFETPLKDLWWSERRREVLDTLSKSGGRLNFEQCAKCPYGEHHNEYVVPSAEPWVDTVLRGIRGWAIETVRRFRPRARA